MLIGQKNKEIQREEARHQPNLLIGPQKRKKPNVKSQRPANSADRSEKNKEIQREEARHQPKVLIGPQKRKKPNVKSQRPAKSTDRSKKHTRNLKRNAKNPVSVPKHSKIPIFQPINVARGGGLIGRALS